MTTTIEWRRSKTGIYTSKDDRWHICCVGKRNEWRLQDTRGRTRYYSSLRAAKDGAVYHADNPD